ATATNNYNLHGELLFDVDYRGMLPSAKTSTRLLIASGWASDEIGCNSSIGFNAGLCQSNPNGLPGEHTMPFAQHSRAVASLAETSFHSALIWHRESGWTRAPHPNGLAGRIVRGSGKRRLPQAHICVNVEIWN